MIYYVGIIDRISLRLLNYQSCMARLPGGGGGGGVEGN